MPRTSRQARSPLQPHRRTLTLGGTKTTPKLSFLIEVTQKPDGGAVIALTVSHISGKMGALSSFIH